MSKKAKLPSTPALRDLKASGVAFSVHDYEYVPQGGTEASARALGVDEHMVVKTLVFEDETRSPFVVLMHGDKQVSAKELARQLHKKRVAPCEVATAERHSGYKVGGTSPFGLRKPLRIFIERSILELDVIYINAGARGLLVEMSPKDLARLLKPTLVEAAI